MRGKEKKLDRRVRENLKNNVKDGIKNLKMV